MECSRASNNKTNTCPPRMSDGRHYTDYRPRCMTNLMYPDNKPMNSYEYRQYLIHNAENLMKTNMESAYNMNVCGPCVEPFDQGTMLPEQNMVTCDASTCSSKMVNKDGLGTGRNYETSASDQSFKQQFLQQKQKEQEFFNKNPNDCATPEDNLQLYPWDGSILKDMNNRNTIPGGAAPLRG